MIRTLLLILCFLCTFSAYSSDIIFAPIAKDKLEMTARIYEPFVKWLSEETGLSIKAKYITNYADILKGFENGTIDMVYLGPLPLLSLESEYRHTENIVTFLSADGTPDYTCSVIAKSNRKINLKTFKGTMALTQPLSTCGHYNAVQTFQKYGRNLDGINFYFSGSHSNVALDVIMGKAAIGSVQTSIAKTYQFQNINIIERSEPYPGFTLVANKKTLSKAVIETIKKSLIEFDPKNNPDDAETAKNWHTNIKYGCVPVNEAIFMRMKKEFAKYHPI